MDNFSSSKMARESWPHGFGILYFILIHSACCCQVASVMSDSVRPHRRQPTRLPRPRDSPGKNTGVGCHFLLQCMKGKSESKGTQSCLTLRDAMDCSPPGSSIHGILQARMLERVALLEGIFPIQGSSPLSLILALAGRFFTTSPTWDGEAW